MFLRRLAGFAGAATFLLPAISVPAQPQDVFPVRSGALAQSLNGEWRFKYIAGADLGADASFRDPAFAGAAAWKTTPVPSHWELHGFAEPKYAKVDDGTGLYRRTFRIPAAWSGQRIFLRFDGVLYGLEAFVNGRSVGTWASSYNPVSFEITDALKPGADADNVLAVQVTTHPKGWEFDTNDCWALSGIYRDVTLFAVPALHFKDCTTRTTLAPDGSAELNVAVTATGPANVSGQLLGPAGERAQSFALALDANGSGATTLKISQPKLWNAETPSLYRLELTLQAEGKSRQQITEKIGLRQVTIEDGILKLNGQPIKLRGVDHHDIWPDEGRVATEELMRRDLALMRAANINFIRTSHYPPHPRFIELCDELGFYVMDEVPFGFGDAHLTDESYQEILLTRARATVMRDKNRPSVIVWSVGNENPNTPLTFATGKRVKELDPTRPICFPQVGSYFERSHQELPEWVDIYAPHYPVMKTLERYAKELKRPIIVTEYAHALGLATDRIQDEWELMQASPHFAGGAVWMFQDQGILRTAEKPTDRATPSLYVWPDPAHYYDTSGNQGMDGIVYSDRTPQTDYWELKKVYAPVQIAERTVDANWRAPTVTLHIENRFDFRSLTGCKLEWTFEKNWVGQAEGVVALTAAAHATEAVQLTLKVPDKYEGNKNFYALRLRCLDEKGDLVLERVVRLAVPSDPPIGDLHVLEKKPPVVSESPAEVRITHPRVSLVLDRQTGVWTIQNPQGETLVQGGYLHVGRRFTEAEALRAKTTPIWTGPFLQDLKDVSVRVWSGEPWPQLIIRGKYPRPDVPDQFIEGEQIVDVLPNGSVFVSYDYNLRGTSGNVLEGGLSLVVPARFSEFRWIGQGPFAGYPGKDRLNEFGKYHLNREDLNFQGNRREVTVAAFTKPTGAGLLLLDVAGNTDLLSGKPGAGLTPVSDVAVENTPTSTIVSQNLVISGRGNKGSGPEKSVKAEEIFQFSGKFLLLPLEDAWPEPVRRWLGKPDEKAPVNHPFFRSYDQ